MIERLDGRAAVAIAAVGLLVIVLVGWFGLVSPQRSKAADLAVKIDDTETQLEVTQALIDGPVLGESTRLLTTLRKAIPDEMQMSEIVRQLSAASAATRVRILSITPAAVVPTGGTDVVAMTVGVQGRYFALRDFLRSLRSRAELDGEQVRVVGRLFGVDSIGFTGRSASDGPATADTTPDALIQATMAITAFSFGGAGTPPTGTSAAVSSGATGEPTAEATTP